MAEEEINGQEGEQENKGITVTQQELDDLKKSIQNLEKNNQELLKEKAEARKKAEKAKADADQAALEAAKASGNIQDVEKSWSDKYEQLKAQSGESVNKYNAMINNLTVEATSKSLSASLALDGHAPLLEPHIKSRLSVEIIDDMPRVRVLDKTGKQSALTVEELAEEFKSDPLFSSVIKGTKARGPGSPNSGGDGGAPVQKMTIAEFNALSQSEKSKFAMAKGEIID